MGSDLGSRIRNVTAVLGPTNTGKTHLAIERMLGHESGMIGLPLRLLAREVYDKIAARVGADKVALITGEEKIKPDRARFWVATVEAMPRDIDVDFLAIDEIQLAADPERGHVFTDRLLNARGRSETLLLGAQTMRDPIADLIPGANFISRPRLSKLSYAGEKKITRLPQRSAVVAFSAAEVYSIAELIRRQRGGAAVVLGALSPRTRNAQVALYQSGDVDFLVATDAIGMGLNLDVDHVAFSALRKFDGQNLRNLTPGELGQIAGRAGRHLNDGSFGVTGGVEPFDAETIERLETHNFAPVTMLQWRNRKLDFGTLNRLHESLREMPREQRLTRARMADDLLALETLSGDREVTDTATTPAAVMRLWEVCQIPDYRKISSQNHAELISVVYKFLAGSEGRIPEDWFTQQVALADRIDGDIDTLSTRLAHIRTWTFVSHRADWLKDPVHWQERTRAIENTLSDALHELLTQRFVDRRTSALMKGMRDKDELSAEIAEDGAIHVESHYVGRLKGFKFSPDAQGEGVHGKAARHAASQVLSRELSMRARRVAAAKTDAFRLGRQGLVLWKDDEIARLIASEDPLKPTLALIADELLAGPDLEKVQARLDAWIGEIVTDRLKPLADLQKAEDVAGMARGIAFQLVESIGILKRDAVAEDVKSLDQTSRAQLRKYGVRFGAFNIYFPILLKPASAELVRTLWSLKSASKHGLSLETMPEPPRAGLTSAAADPAVPEAFYRACGYHVCGTRAVRIDILERLADLIRPLLAWRPHAETPSALPPKGSTGDGGFLVTPEMMSILGCSTEDIGGVLKTLGFRLDRRLVKIPAPQPEAAESSSAVSEVSLSLPELALQELALPEKDTEGAPGAMAVLDTETPTAMDAAPLPETIVSDDVSADLPVDSIAMDPVPLSVPLDAEPLAKPIAEPPSESPVPIVASAESQTETALPEIAVPETATAEVALQETGIAALPAEAPTPEEPKFEDVWRPRRHRAEGPRPERSRPRRDRHFSPPQTPALQDSTTPSRVASEPASDGAVQTDIQRRDISRSDTEQHGPDRDVGRDSHQETRPDSRPYDGARNGRRSSEDGERGRRRESDGPRRESDGGTRGKPGGERRSSEPRRGTDGDRGRPGGRDGGRDRERGPPRPSNVVSAAPPAKKGAQSDSPFAALSALRDALAQRGKDPASS